MDRQQRLDRQPHSTAVSQHLHEPLLPQGFVSIENWMNFEVGGPPEVVAHSKSLIEAMRRGERLDTESFTPPEISKEAKFSERIRARFEVLHAMESIAVDLKAPQKLKSAGPDHIPNPKIDVSAYIGRWSATYSEYVAQLARQIPPMRSECRLSIAIPVAAHEEGKYVRDTLQSFKAQTADTEKYEIILFLNFPTRCTETEFKRVEATVAEIDQFAQDNPDRSIYCMKAGLAGHRIKTIGFIRSFLNDAILLRYSHGAMERDHILLRCDADTRGVPARYIENFIGCFEAHPTTDAFVGRLRWSPEHCVENPLVFANQRIAELIDIVSRRNLSELPVGGPLYALKASVYALVNGYQEHTTLGEDVELGYKVQQFRRGSTMFTAHADAGHHSKLFTSTRRAEAALWVGQPCMNQWSIESTEFGVENASIRSPDPSDCVAPTISDPRELQNAIQLILNRAIQSRFGACATIADQRCVDQFLEYGVRRHLGIDFARLPNNLVRINSIEGMLGKFEEYRENGLNRWQNTLKGADRA